MMAAMIAASGSAYTTKGDKSVYTFKTLSEIDGSGVTASGDGTYTVSNTLEIAATDTLRLEDGDNVLLMTDVEVNVQGYGDFTPSVNATFDRASRFQNPRGVSFSSETADGELNNVTFRYCALKYAGKKDFSVKNCKFYNVTTAMNSNGAIALGCSGNMTVTVENCRFEDCEVTGIGGAANFTCGVTFKNNYMKDCNTANVNKPFVNLTVGGDLPVVIEGNTIVGNKRNMVGGIGVSNLLNHAGAKNVIIRNNDVRYCRYGITTTGPMNAVISGNTLIENCYESNAMNGGSGISVYDPYYMQTVMISGNYIEGSLWGVTVIGCKDANLGKTSVPEDDATYNPGGNEFKNNGNGGVKYDLYNNSTNTVYAQNNTWGVDTQDESSIETVIFHKKDNASLGEVIFMPAKSGSGINEVEATADIYYDASSDMVKLPEVADARVYTMNGAMVLAAKGVSAVELSELSSGVYVVKACGKAIKVVK